MTSPPVDLAALTRINTDDIFDALGLAQLRRGRRWLSALFQPAAGRFARQISQFDARVGAQGLPDGAEWILRQFVREVQVTGRARIPARGPVLVLSNHPGMVDTVALFVSLGRPDLRVVALERPFLKALPNTSRQMIYVPEAASARMGVVRAVAAALRAGQAVLTFPAGEIEPDPAVHGAARAVAALENWSESVSAFARLAPETVIVPALVSGVLSPAAQGHPVTRLRRRPADRERMAAMLQVMVPLYQSVTVRVAFGEPGRAADWLAAHPEPAALRDAVTRAVRGLIEQPSAEWRTVLRGVR